MKQFFGYNQTDARLARIERLLEIILRVIKRGQAMAQADIDALKTKVERNTTVSQSAVTLIGGLAQQIRDLADDPEQLRALADQLEASTTPLADAVAANTPAA